MNPESFSFRECRLGLSCILLLRRLLPGSRSSADIIFTWRNSLRTSSQPIGLYRWLDSKRDVESSLFLFVWNHFIKLQESGTAAGIYGFWLACAACVPQQSKLTHTLCGSRFLFCGNRLRLRLRATNLDLFSSSL